MIVEFIGCTGAGKTTFASGVMRQLGASGHHVRDHRVTHSSLLASVANLASTPVRAVTVFRHRSTFLPYILAVCFSACRRRPGPFWTAARILAVIRRSGEHADRVRTDQREIGIVDEGVLGLFDMAFSGSDPPSAGEVQHVISRAPLPEVIVWVDAPLDALVERTVKRLDSPRELRNRSRGHLEMSLANIRSAYESLATTPCAAARLIRAWNPQESAGRREIEIARVAALVEQKLTQWRA